MLISPLAPCWRHWPETIRAAAEGSQLPGLAPTLRASIVLLFAHHDLGRAGIDKGKVRANRRAIEGSSENVLQPQDKAGISGTSLNNGPRAAALRPADAGVTQRLLCRRAIAATLRAFFSTAKTQRHAASRICFP
jgi:hypothetical protein